MQRALAIKEISKEQIQHIQFIREDVLKDPAKVRLRNIYLTKAERLGNGYKGKVKMTMISLSGEHLCVETTIWAANEDYVSLKGGIFVPTKAILDIEFY